MVYKDTECDSCLTVKPLVRDVTYCCMGMVATLKQCLGCLCADQKGDADGCNDKAEWWRHGNANQRKYYADCCSRRRPHAGSRVLNRFNVI